MLETNQFHPEGIDNAFVINVGNFKVSKSIGFIFTNKCNAKCNFCCNNSSPKGIRGLDTNAILNIIDSAVNFGFRQVGLSGGEAMMRYRDILLIAKKCKSKEITFTLATNGFWARDKAKAIQILSKLKDLGLSRLLASHDEAHAVWVSSQSFENMLCAAKEIDVPVLVSSAYYREGKRLNELISHEALDGVKVYENPVIWAGRAKSEPLSNMQFSDCIPESTCPSPVQITINYDGNAYPCCSVSGFSKHLILGNIKTDSLEDILHALLKKPFLHYIQRRGFSKILGNMTDSKKIELPNVLTACDLCSFVTSSNNVLLNCV